MSRSLRHNATKPPPAAKKTARKSRHIEESSDDDYSGVDLITDSEDDDEDVKAAEEQAIIESEYEDDDNLTATPRPDDDDDDQVDDDHSSWGGFDLDSEANSQSVAGTPASNHFFADAVANDANANFSEWNATEREVTPKPRRVHFASDSSDDEDDENDNIFPDIFLEQDRLDSRFLREIENDRNRDNDDPPSEDGSFWDYNGDNPDDVPTNGNVDEETSSEESDSSSGYETDEGETTEEDMPTPNRFVNAKSILRRPSTDSSSTEEDIPVPPRRNPFPRRGPQLGTWFADPNKPYAIVDTSAKKLVVVNGRSIRSASFNGTPSRPLTSFAPDFNMEESPMISNSGNLMLSAMYNMGGVTDGQAVGPPEAFYPFVSINADGGISQDDSASYDDDDVEEDDAWDIDDLFDFGEGGATLEEEEDTSDPNATDVPSTPARPLSSEDQVHPLLEHFDRTSVNAFRRNQNRHALVTRNTASKESLAFGGQFGGPIRGIKRDRMAAAHAPITPVRKPGKRMDMTPSSPAVAVADNKRKRDVSGEHHGHKRSRSLV